MDNKKYSIGMDFGTLSARAILVDIKNGTEEAISVVGYQDAVIDDVLPESGQKLPKGYALQNPHNYIEAMESLLRDILRKSRADPSQIIGIGLDTTASTVLPVDRNYVPLCFHEKYKKNPHSWIKLWKHHGAQKQADRLNAAADRMGLEFINRCGGRVSAEWMYPKIMETLEEAPEIYDAAYRFMELGDWLVYLLTGQEKRNSIMAFIHAQWDGGAGFPPNQFFKSLDPRLDGLIEAKIGSRVQSAFEKAGGLTRVMAKKTGLLAGTAVAMANSDGPVAIPGLGIVEEGTAALILGTSSVLMYLSRKDRMVKGAMGMAKEGWIPGFCGHILGQSAVGDIFEWFMNTMVPYRYYKEAETEDISIFDVMNRKVEHLPPAQTGLLALDWLNGNRSVLQNADLSGVLIGLNLSTTPEEIYRALIEATAFGMKKIIASVEEAGIALREIYACGGLARKSPTIMQIFSDVLGLRIRIAASSQTIALGSAMMGAVAAGKTKGGYDGITEAAIHMSRLKEEYYEPDPGNHARYRRMYKEYERMHDYFGIEQKEIMKKLRNIQ